MMIERLDCRVGPAGRPQGSASELARRVRSYLARTISKKAAGRVRAAAASQSQSDGPTRTSDCLGSHHRAANFNWRGAGRQRAASGSSRGRTTNIMID
jgi:hypothetical protein